MTIRERAIQICLLAANEPSGVAYGQVCTDLGLEGPWDHKAGLLAVDAWVKANSYLPASLTGRPWTVDVDLLAAELLEAGWKPGELIEKYLR